MVTMKTRSLRIRQRRGRSDISISKYPHSKKKVTEHTRKDGPYGRGHSAKIGSAGTRNSIIQRETSRKGLLLVNKVLESKRWRVTEKIDKFRSSYRIENHDRSIIKTVRIRSLSKKNAVPMGNSLRGYNEDLLIVCRNLSQTPEIFVLTMEQALQKVSKNTKLGLESYWLERSGYEEFLDNWYALGE